MNNNELEISKLAKIDKKIAFDSTSSYCYLSNINYNGPNLNEKFPTFSVPDPAMLNINV